MNTTSTLVETVNINLEDFSETFLTCSTCLYTYDQNDALSLRCPMCREVCALPAGGVHALPAAFLINQLLDVMQKQRKDVVPSCTIHPTEQLLYCECCDLVFCQQCQTSVIK
ncbi:unnamed protein product [Heligmosomoides polygyrus]|uniref:B box-type domain-containing protein n=1 Tax=Heligmosomoides polygyrus TaxID=6339 RepID=A0A183GK85_HELPZ|nr:unnamed protein product [Heligmosomoides polygyrus]